MNKLFKRILNSTCLLYTISSFILNFISWLSFYSRNQNRMLEIWANLIILSICLIVSSIVVYKRRKIEVNIRFIAIFISYVGIIYTITSMIVNVIQYIIKKENFWNGYTLLILLLFSVVASFLILKIKNKSYLISSIVNFFILGIFYYIIFAVKAGYTKGNSILISLGIYFIIYIVSAITYYLINKKRHKKQNAEKNYNNLFS